MKPTPTAPTPDEGAPLLAFGAHPDDIEFGCGGIVAQENQRGRRAHFVVCSQGESATHGTPAERAAESENAARLLGATLEFLTLDGDAHLEIRAAHALTLAGVIRQVRPEIVLAPTLVENQHPDHWRLARLVCDAARLARYGGVAELRAQPPHTIHLLLHYAITVESEPPGAQPILLDISDAATMTAWRAAMRAHVSQGLTRPYEELQLTRARTNGLRAGVEYAQALFPHDPLVFDSLAPLTRSARCF